MKNTRRPVGTNKQREFSGLIAQWEQETFAKQREFSRLIAQWERQPFAGAFLPLTLKARLADQAFLDQYVLEVRPFDCFMIGGWRPNENQLSDVIAGLFDQNWGHDHSPAIFDSFLKVARGKSASPAIDYIQSLSRNERHNFSVKREQSGADSRADIDIYGQNFLVRIEHKIRGGSETLVRRKGQASRLLGNAIDRAKLLQIDKMNVCCVFLTPEGRAASIRDFIPLSFGDFADGIAECIRQALSPASCSRCCARAARRHRASQRDSASLSCR